MVRPLPLKKTILGGEDNSTSSRPVVTCANSLSLSLSIHCGRSSLCLPTFAPVLLFFLPLLIPPSFLVAGLGRGLFVTLV
jgi:hypothetical protein